MKHLKGFPRFLAKVNLIEAQPNFREKLFQAFGKSSSKPLREASLSIREMLLRASYKSLAKLQRKAFSSILELERDAFESL